MEPLVLVIGYNRPHYFKRCIESIVANNPRRVIVSVDGGALSLQDDYKRLTPKGYEFITHKERLGVAHHLFEMRDLAFAQAPVVTVVEDDVVLASNYLKFAEKFLDWSDQFDDVGAVSGWRHCLMTPEEKLKNKRKVELANSNWIVYTMRRQCWFGIRDTMKEYLDKFIVKGQYKSRDSNKIRDWARSKFIVDEKSCANPFPRHEGAFWAPGLFESDKFPSSQDGMLVGSFFLHGWKKINTIVNRCVYIGEVGEHGNKGGYVKAGFGDMTLDLFDEDGEFEI